MVTPELYNDMRYAVIGDLLLMDDCGPLLEELREDLFGGEPWISLYRGIRDQYGGTGKIDILLLRERLGDSGHEQLVRAMETTPSAANWKGHAAALQEAKRIRDLQTLGLAVCNSFDGEEIGQLVMKMQELLGAQREKRTFTAAEMATDFIARMRAKKKPEYIRLGFPELDRRLYLERGDFLVIGGYASAGKTMLALQFAWTLGEAGYRVGFFSFETNEGKITDRLMAFKAQVELRKIKRKEAEPKVNADEAAALTRAAEAYFKLPFEVTRASGYTVDEIKALTVRRGYDVVIVDYLQIVTSAGKNRYEQVTEISQGLHTLSQSRGVFVIALAQLNRAETASEKRGEKTVKYRVPPTLASLRESGQIEQDADAVLLLWAEDPQDNRSGRILKIAKNKEGERAEFRLDFDGATQTLRPHQETRGEHYTRINREIREAGKGAPSPGQISFKEVEDDEKEELPF